MGWNTSALFVRDRSIDQLIDFLPDVFSFEPSSTYSFWLYENGVLVRHATFESGNCIEHTGAALAIESKVAIPSWGHDEDFLWAVITAITGLKDDTDQVFAVYSVD